MYSRLGYIERLEIMAGVNGNWNNLNAMDSLYRMNNPYAMNSMMTPYASTMNDDFMAQTAFGNGLGQQQTMGYPSAFQGYTGLQQPTTDSFEKQEQGGSLVVPTVLALGAGGATAASVYKWGTTNPIKDGKVDQNLINAFNKETVKNSNIANFGNLYNKEAQKVYDIVGIKDAKQFEAVKKLSLVTDLEKLPPEIRSQLPATIQTPQAAKTVVGLVTDDLNKIDKEIIARRATGVANQGSLKMHQTNLQKHEALLEKVKGLSKDATKEDLVKFFKENEKLYGITGTEVQKTAKAERLAQRYGTQEALLNHLTERIDHKKARINELNINLESQIKSHWDEATKTFKKDAPEVLTKAEKSFKLTKAGKWGALAAAGGLVLGWLFGNNA